MKKKKAGAGRLTHEEMMEFRALLLAKQKEILGNVIFMEDETLRKSRTDLSNMPFHMADMGSDNYEMENTVGLVDSERRLLVEIQDAIARIDDGTFGVCRGDGEPIPKARLKAIPWTPYCVACAALAEKGQLAADRPAADRRAAELEYGDMDDGDE